ncbi:MAG: hypothetical protein K9L74_06815 [Candidatus Izimaplasma sp.]|nr:hypothetical protein [Candidatus Izimaplasma bacterium]
MDKFEDKIRDDLTSQTPDVLGSIKESRAYRDFGRSPLDVFKSVLSPKRALVFAGMLVVLLMVFMNVRETTDVVAATVTLDINPSIQIELNGEDEVISIVQVDDNGETIIEHDVQYLGLSLDEALELIIERLNALGYIVESDTESNVVVIYVNAKNTSIRDRLETKLETKIGQELGRFSSMHHVINSRLSDLDQEQVELARRYAQKHGITMGRMRFMYQIIHNNNTHTLAELKDKSVRELYDIYQEEMGQHHDPFNHGPRH